MTGTLFVAIIPGVIDDQARDARLSGGATGLYRLLIEHADRHTGNLSPVTVAELADLSRFGRKTVRGYLDELEAAGLAELDLRQGHDGSIRLPRHAEVIHKGRSRQMTQRSRQMTQRSRQMTQRSRQSTRANRGNEDREKKKTEGLRPSVSTAVGARANGSAGAPPPGGPYVSASERDRVVDRVVDIEDALQEAAVDEDLDRFAYYERLHAELSQHGYWDDENDDAAARLTEQQVSAIDRICAEARGWLDGEPVDWMPDQESAP